MYWGYKFEALSLLPRPWPSTSREEIEQREDDIVDNSAQYCSLCKTGIAGASMIIGGEVDGVLGYKPEDPNEPARWVELKTARRPQNDKNIRIHEKKLLKFWAQSFLLGVPKIIIGYRSPDGILESLEELDTQRMPGHILRNGRFIWDGSLCINFTGAFLEFLKKTVGGSEGVWRIRRAARSGIIEVFKVEETGTGQVLSESFVGWRTQSSAASGVDGNQPLP
ncbi:hypothetical protein AAFC00_002922 [Neodothiora populina]|uniref:Decapping nuclease n=1 Tax=Neodothiora populina TaxID=2781224 RepID=A0ABR3P932_9PEZI